MESSHLKKIKQETKNLKNNFSNKIKTIDELQRLFGERPRKKTVVMCHGTFDIVHPGHLRQLIYAKSKGDILIVSLTIDKYVSKGHLRPYVPQQLRALNLAAFEIVDYVIIDPNPTPVENILKLQPDFFVKGFEYSLQGIHPKTKEEIEALESYGGEMVFSPGDIVYSSSKILSLHKPNLSIERLLNIMAEEKITFKTLSETIRGFKKIKVHVVGDTIIDKYSKCSILGPSSKAAAFSVRLDETNSYIGGAGIVAKHLKSLGSTVTFTTIVGNDEAGKSVIKEFKKLRIKSNAMIDKTKPTTIKERFITGEGQLLLQVDTVDNSIAPDKILTRICNVIKKSNPSAVICSDFRHGIFNSESIAMVSSAIPKNSLKIADSQVSNRWGNILDFTGFDLITPNEKEARFALGDQDTTIGPLVQKLYNNANCRYLILKLGKEGLMTYKKPLETTREYSYLDSFVESLVDPIGAGDALLSAATLALTVSKSITQASIIGNMCAALECSRLGNIPVSSEELLELVESFENNSYAQF